MRDEDEEVDNEEEESKEPKGYRVGPSTPMGTGLLDKARDALLGRRRAIDDAIAEAEGKKK